jgi:DUF4097 and DUF4098 domain-containing protein YvlB
VTAKLERGGKVSINGPLSSLKITGREGDEVQATPVGGGAPVTIQTVGDAARPRLVIGVSRRYGRECDLEVKLPKYADLEISGVHTGDIAISDVDGKIDVNTGSGDLSASRVGTLAVTRLGGDISVSNVKGEFIAKSTHGDVAADNVNGRVEISLTSGDIRVTNAGGDVRAMSAAGDIELHCVKGSAEVASASGSITLIGISGDAEASTSSGEVSFKGRLRAGGNYSFKSISGEVEVVVQPDPPGFTATLITYSGEIDTNFPLKLDSPLDKSPVNRRVIGRYGDGQTKIKLDSFNGGVRIVKGGSDLGKQCK